MKTLTKISIALLIILAARDARAVTTWYVSTAGGWGVQTYGSIGQCNGQSPAAYPDTAYPMWNANTTYALNTYVVDFNNNLQKVTTAGISANQYPPSWNTSGTTTDNTVTWTYQRAMAANKNCALRHPYFLINQNTGGNTWLTSGGDIVQFLDVGPYPVGQVLPNGTFGNYFFNSNCVGQTPPCTFTPPPNGTSGSPTTFRGVNYASCHNSTHTGLTGPTILSGINNVFSDFNVQNTNYVTLECLEFTQPDFCTTSGTGAGRCVTGTNNFVGASGGGGLILQLTTGKGPSNLTLQDIGVVGTSSSGILGSYFNTSGTDVTTFSDVYVIANGSAGINGDGGDCGTSCESVGTVNASYVTVAWNGCVLASSYNWTAGYQGNSYNYCFDDNNAGYGDGWVTIASGNGYLLNVTHSTFAYNTQDGFDSLHLSDDLTKTPSVSIQKSQSIGNMGQTFKLGAGATFTAINNFSSSNCKVMQTASNFPLNPTGWNAGLTDFCRAAGDQWAFQFSASTVGIFELNTSVGYGATMYDFEPAYGASPGAGTQLTFTDNISVGYPDPNSGTYPGGLYFNFSNPLANTGSSASHNLWDTMSGNTCPSSSYETAYVCNVAPNFFNAAINALNPNIHTGSPAAGAGVAISGITTDYNGATRPNPPSIGAFEPTVAAAIANGFWMFNPN